jgi:hypothetical protein
VNLRRFSSTTTCVLFVAASAFATDAAAGTGGREKNRSAPYLYKQYLTLQANVSYTIETLNLTAGGDTVIHVNRLEADGGGFVDGNDDCYTRLTTCTGLRSWLNIPATSVARDVWVIVRASSSASGGTATLRVTPSNGPAADTSIIFSLGYKKNLRFYRNSSHFLTVEEQGGSLDTVMLVLSDFPWKAIKFDDDNGVGFMSWIHVDQDCASNCSVVLGSFSTFTEGNTTFIWDEDIHFDDPDVDGMSTALESALGTNPLVADTDADGLKDGEDTMGIDHGLNILRFPYYGSEPLVKDLFIEADWRKCTPKDSEDWTCGDPMNPNQDKWQLSASDALAAIAIFAPDVAVHIDNGVANTDPTTRTKYGKWEGATRQSAAKTANKCDWRNSERAGFFHGARIEGIFGGQAGPGACFDSGRNPRALSHECAHNMNLSHGGRQSGGADVNCKPNYRSIMNYALTYNESIDFSGNEFANVQLNPTAMYETAGLGTADPAKIEHLKSTGFRYTVNSWTGAVDWNRDGWISAGPVRAAATWGWGAGGCDITAYGGNDNVSRHRRGTALAWFPWPSSSRLYWFTRRESDGTIEYRHATTFPTSWTPNISGDATLLPSSLGGDGAPAAASMTGLGGDNQLVVFYKDTSSRLRMQRMLVSMTGGWGTIATEGWQLPVYVGSGAEVIQGDPAAVRWNDGIADEIDVYAVVGTGNSARLKEWRILDTTTSMPIDQLWADGTPIVPAYGIGIATGYVTSSSGATLHRVAAIPLNSPIGQIEVAWKDSTTGLWTRLPTSNWTNGRLVTQAQPGIAYAPYDRTVSLTEGRFYIAMNPTVNSGGGREAGRLIQTQGNNLTSFSRRFVWNQDTVYYSNEWGFVKGNMTLLYDLTYDSNVRGAYTFDYISGSTNYRELSFSPFADGIFDDILKDQDDYAVIKSNLRCALGKGACL